MRPGYSKAAVVEHDPPVLADNHDQRVADGGRTLNVTTSGTNKSEAQSSA